MELCSVNYELAEIEQDMTEPQLWKNNILGLQNKTEIKNRRIQEGLFKRNNEILPVNYN